MYSNNGALAPEEQRILEKLPLSVCVFSIREGRCSLLLVTDGLCSRLGMDRREIEKSFASGFEKAFHPEDRRKIRFDIEKACLDPQGEYEAFYRICAGADSRDYRWISCRGKIKRLDDGSYVLYVHFSDINDVAGRTRETESEKNRLDALFSEILETTRTPIFWKDADRRFLGANQAFLDYYGFPDENAIIGRNDEDMGWHTEPDPYKNDEIQVLRSGISTHRVPGMCIAHGENRNIVASKSPLRIDGKIVGLVGSFEDVTVEYRQSAEIRRLNENLNERIDYLNMIMESTGVNISKLRLDDDYTVEWADDIIYRSIGYSRQEFTELFHDKMRLYFTGEYEKELDILGRNVARALEEKRRRFTIIMKIPLREGFAWISGVGTFADYDEESGQPQSLFLVHTDITEIMSMQERLHAAEKRARKAEMLESENSRLRRIIDSVPSGIGFFRVDDREAHAITFNRYIRDRVELPGENAGQVSLKDLTAIFQSDDRGRYLAGLQAIIDGNENTASLYRIRKKGGDGYYWVQIRTQTVRRPDGTKICYVVCTNENELIETQSRLEESRRFYREAVIAAKLITWEYDIDNHHIIMSEDESTETDFRKFGIGKITENVPDSLVGYIDADYRQRFLQMYHDVDEGRDASCEVWYDQENGREPRCERITYIQIEEEAGGRRHAIGLGQNITAEKKVEERYERELGYMRDNSENNLMSKGHYNLTKNKVLEYTRKTESVYAVAGGMSYDDALAGLMSRAFRNSDRQALEDMASRHSLTRRYQAGEMKTNLRFRYAVPGQFPLWISLNIHTYMMPETGELECFTYAYDVSEKVQTDEIVTLISEEEFDYIGLIFSETSEFEFIKKTAEVDMVETHKRLNYDLCCSYVRENFVDDEETAQFDEAVSLENIMAGLRAAGKYVSTYHRTENGRTLCKQIDYVWLDEEAGIILSVRSDVTAGFNRDRERIAQIQAAKLEAEQANEAKSEFLSSMSHDLRTPLNGVLGFTELAIREQNPDVKQEYLHKIESSGRLLLDLVNDTLELSRIESGKISLDQEAVMLTELVPSVITALRPSAELKSIALTTEIAPQIRYPVWCDRLKMQKIVLNLVSNAIKYTPEGGRVRVALEQAADPGRTQRYILTVEDNGIGMSEEFMKRMYEPFAQEKRSESLKINGTGLGLAIVRKYVDLMDGMIEVESRIHEGTRFAVHLPLAEVMDEQKNKSEEETCLASLAGMHVLLCEDNYMNTEIAVMLLKDKGIDVDTAENGREGLKKFAASPEGFYDAVLMDLRMPVMDGNEATESIRKLARADAGRVRIIAMTADAFEESIQAARRSGMDDYLTKPVEPDKLYRLLAGAAGSQA